MSESAIQSAHRECFQLRRERDEAIRERDEARDMARVMFRSLRHIQATTSRPHNSHTEALLKRCPWLKETP